MFKVTRTLPFVLTTLAVSLAATVAVAASLSRGSRGPEVERLQKKLGLSVDGKFGKDTEDAVKAFQTKNSLTADGKVGKSTLKLLYPADAVTEDRKLREGDTGNDVEELQTLLIGKGESITKADGKFGPKTGKALRSFQKKKNLTPDGVAGAATWAKLRASS